MADATVRLGDGRIRNLSYEIFDFYDSRLKDAVSRGFGKELEQLVASTSEHTKRVVSNVDIVCEKAGLKPEPVDYAAALCHDIDKAAYQSDFPEYKSLSKPAWFSLKSNGHGMLSSMMCQGYLEQADFSNGEKEEVMGSVAVHDDRFITKGMGQHPFVLIVSDKLDRLGEVGARRLYDGRVSQKKGHQEAVSLSRNKMKETYEVLMKMQIDNPLLTYLTEKWSEGTSYLGSMKGS